MKSDPALFGRSMTPHRADDGTTIWALGLRRGPVRVSVTVQELHATAYSWRLLCNGIPVSLGAATTRRKAVSRLAQEVGNFELAFSQLELGKS